MRLRTSLIAPLLLVFATTSAPAAVWQHEDLSFGFKSLPNDQGPGARTVLRDEWIRIDPFEAPGFPATDRQGLVTPEFRVIFGEGSESIFDALGTDEVAGLRRADARKHIEKLRREGRTEADGAFIAGLTNVHEGRIFMFFNVTRLRSSTSYSHRVLTHEPLHLARMLISKGLRPSLDFYKDAYRRLDDRTEELFAETLERGAAIALDRYRQLPRTPSR